MQIEGEQFVLVPASEYRSLQLGAEAARLPLLPPRGTDGMYPAIEHARASLARKIILERVEVGLTQSELAQRARIRLATLQRVESGKHTPSAATIDKIERALRRAAKSQGRRQSS